MNERKRILQELLGRIVHVEVDRPIGYIHGDIGYPVNYGYIPGVMAADGEEQDVYILGVDRPLTAFDGQVVGAVCRLDDVEDKLIVAPAGMVFHQGQLAEAVHFQEQYFDTRIISLLRKSCGVLAWRETEAGREYLVVFEAYSQCWSLPKGHMEAGETEEQTALRELFEETGLTAALDTGRRAVIEYALTREYPRSPTPRKQVVIFSGQAEGIPKAQEGEIQRCKWVTAGELKDYLFPDTVEAISPLLCN